MARAVELAWQSVCAGSLGIGSTISNRDGMIIATGRNRLFEQDAGDDHLAGTALAHAEMNALAKIAMGARSNELTLWTTLQPCLQCTGAIRMSRIGRVEVLAPDPLFREVDRIRDLSPFIARHWPEHARHDTDAVAAFALLLPSHVRTFWGAPDDDWERSLPTVSSLASELVASGELIDHAQAGRSAGEVLGVLWSRLQPCIDDVEALWMIA
jgi:tRNA(Arg) A34 adenosine deaminase TadA